MQKKPIIVALMLLAFFVFLTIVPPILGNQWLLYFDKSYSGQVIDSETGKPLENAVVVGLWQLTQIPGEGFGGYAKIKVATTDKEGRFNISPWINFKPWKLLSVTHGLSPRIVIYKPGYKVIASHKLQRAGYPDDKFKSQEEKAVIKEEYSLNPAKLTRVYTDEKIWHEYGSFESNARFPDKHYSKKYLRIIFKSLEESAKHLSLQNKNASRKIIKDVGEYRTYWTGGKI